MAHISLAVVLFSSPNLMREMEKGEIRKRVIMGGSVHHSSLLLGLSAVASALHYSIGLARPTTNSSSNFVFSILQLEWSRRVLDGKRNEVVYTTECAEKPSWFWQYVVKEKPGLIAQKKTECAPEKPKLHSNGTLLTAMADDE
uniref:Uncharacterized protein n=1 Tax=Salix viminalis TaxID=40686 RepID=A0A6N2LY91_SALVM